MKCHLKLLIDITLHYINRALETATCGGRRRYDQLVSVRYHRDHFDDLQDLTSHGDFIDDDHLLQHRVPPPAAAGNDVTVTSHDRSRQSPVTSKCRRQSHTPTVNWYSITHSLFHSRLKTSLLSKSFPLQPFLFLLKYLLRGFAGLFTVISEHRPICFLLLVFSVFTLFSCRFRAVD